MKTIFYISIILSLLTLTIGCQPKKSPRLVFSKYEIDFGKVGEGTNCSTSVTIYNKGNAKLNLLNVGTDCPCTKVQVANRTIDAGDSTILHITLETKGKVGDTENFVIIQANTDSTIHYIPIIAHIKEM